MTSSPLPLAAVILSGGTGARLGGADKASIEVEGVTLLEHALAATDSASETVVVGPAVPTSRLVTWVREDPPGAGPAAGLLTGLRSLATSPAHVCVLAVDMPRFTAMTLLRLREALGAADDADGACLLDEAERKQWLAGVYRHDALRATTPARRDSEPGLSVRRLMLPLRVVAVRAVDEEAHDVDTWADLLHLRGPDGPDGD